ncbi:MAG: hypothetical protein K0S41_197 [Anaerocolumna sp.]|jgi:Flp pilus assembly protein TadD|nr:hypothetical protein [Anaerocolumna sp.]
MNIVKNNKDFNILVNDAIVNLQRHDYMNAYQSILKAVGIDPNRPEPQNLLGIMYEFKGDSVLARKHYRMAYVLDPIYKPATNNLERVSTLFLNKVIPVDYGEIVILDNIPGDMLPTDNLSN